jgi:hypothetical protein
MGCGGRAGCCEMRIRPAQNDSYEFAKDESSFDHVGRASKQRRWKAEAKGIGVL